MSHQNNFLDELAALLQKYKVDVSAEDDGILFYSSVLYNIENIYALEPEINVTLPSDLWHDNITSTIQSFKE
jgi:hypothetical protein